MAYHISEIPKGVIGEFSKITEEYEELLDAHNQKDSILELCEITDLIGAIEEYLKNFNITLEDAIKFSNKTKQAFKENKR